MAYGNIAMTVLANIRNVDHFLENKIIDYAPYNGAFTNPKIKLGDSDATLTEIQGHLLIIEFKSHDVTLNIGQKLMYENLAKVGSVTTIVLWIDDNQVPEHAQVFWSSALKSSGVQRLSVEGYDSAKSLMRKWELLARENSKLVQRATAAD